MTNQIALYLGIILILGIGGDILGNDSGAVIFLMHKFVDLVEWVAFWR